MSHYRKAVTLRQTNGDVPILFLRVIRVGYGSAKCITEDYCGFVERDFMFTDILRFLCVAAAGWKDLLGACPLAMAHTRH